MPIEVECQSCGRILRAPDKAAGRQAKCPECSAVVRISDAAAESDPFDNIFDSEIDDIDELGEFADTYDARPTRSRRDERPCPVCGEYIKARAVRCRFCGESLREAGEPSYFRPQSHGDGISIASMVCGIVALVLFCFLPLSVPLALLAIVLAIVEMANARSEGRSRNGMAIAGLVCGILPLAFWLTVFMAAATDNNWFFRF